MDDSVSLAGVEKTIHEVEIYVGILIGAVTFAGSVIAYYAVKVKKSVLGFILWQVECLDA